MNSIDDDRRAAIGRLNAKREFRQHLAVFVLVNSMLIVIWAATGAGFFWPIWPIGGWAIGLAAHASGVYLNRSFTEEDIHAEMRRSGSRNTQG